MWKIRFPERPSQEAVKVMLMLQEVPGYRRCKNSGTSAKESCRCKMELAQERSHVQPAEWEGQSFPRSLEFRRIHQEPQILDTELQGFMITLLGLGLALSDLSLLSPCMSLLDIVHQNYINCTLIL